MNVFLRQKSFDDSRGKSGMGKFMRKIVLENGQEFYGEGFGAKCDAINELVFNTSMVGYQEIVSDPVSYTHLDVYKRQQLWQGF